MRCRLNAVHIYKTAVELSIVSACLALSAPLSAQGHKPRATFEGHTQSVKSLAFSPDGKTLASASPDYSINLWDVVTGQNTATLTALETYGWCSVAFSPDGKTLAAGGYGNKIKLWNVASGKCTTILDEVSPTAAPCVAFSPDGKILASGGKCNSNLALWEVATGKNIVTLNRHEKFEVCAVTFTPDSKSLASVSHDDGIKLWDVATGKENTTRLKPADKKRIETLIGNLGNSEFVERKKAARELQAVGPLAIDMLKPATKRPDAEISDRAARLIALLEASGVTKQMDGAAVFSPDCTTLAAATSENSVKLWEVATGKERSTLNGHATAYVRALAFSPDGKTLAAGSEDGSIKLWNVARGTELATYKGGHGSAVLSLAFSPDGKTLASGSKDLTIKLWDLAKRK